MSTVRRAAVVGGAVAALVAVLVAVGTATDEGDGADCPGASALVMTRNERASEGRVGVVAVDASGAVRLVTGDWVATAPALSPDGEQVVVTRAEGDYESSGPESTSLWIIGVDGSDPRQLTDGPFDDDPAWSPDGRTIAFVRRAGSTEGGDELSLVGASGGPPTVLLPAAGDVSIGVPTWSHDGRWLAFLRRGAGATPGDEASTGVWIVDGDGGEPRFAAEVPGAHTLAWTPDGASLLVSELGGEDGTVSVLDVDTGRRTVLFERAALGDLSHDGARVYFVQRDTPPPEMTRWRLMVAPLDGSTAGAPTPVGDVSDHYVYGYARLDVGPCG